MAKKSSKFKTSTRTEPMQKSQPTKRVISVSAMNEGQKEALRVIAKKKITIISGSPGTGKSHISVAWALQEMINGRFDRIILTRPVVEAGESLGFLPGDAEQKIAPYMMPMLEILGQYLSQDDIRKFIEEKIIMILPIAYMRGVTFRNACVIADESQNMSHKQIHLLLTRLGEGSKIILTGDVEQSDLRFNGDKNNGLRDAIERLSNIEEIGMVNLGYEWCVRDPLVNKVDEAYRSGIKYSLEMDSPVSFDSLLRSGALDDISDDDLDEEEDWEECDCEEGDPDCNCE